jgi:LacI family transcriptional regulator
MKTYSEENPGAGGGAPPVKRGRATMKDVAAVAKVSLSTVSRVVNGQQVDPVLAERVREAAELLGYRRDHTASSLRRLDRLSSSIGVVWPDVSNAFFAGVQRGVEEVTRGHDFLTFVGSSDEDPERERALALAFGSRGVDGLIIAPAGEDESYLMRDRDAGIALVFLDRPPHLIDGDVVLSDNRGGVGRAVEQLHAQGHRRIAFLGGLHQLYTAKERLAGYREALLHHGVGEDSSLVRLDLDDASASDFTRELMLRSDRPTALVTAQNFITLGAVDALHRLGLQQDIAVIGYDEVPLGGALDPALTVLEQDPATLGRLAAEMLFERLDGHTGPGRRVEVAPELIRRGSGEIPGPAADSRESRSATQ